MWMKIDDRSVVMLMILIISSYTDIKKREIPVKLVVTGTIFGLVTSLLKKEGFDLNICVGCIPGVCLLILSVLMRENIGLGDGLVVFMGGFYLSFFQVIEWLFYSFLLCSFVGLLLVMVKRMKIKDTLAFVPFLLLVYISLQIL